jgi:hypothetical protein
LLARRYDGFADHADFFWVTIDGDLERAFRLVQRNLARATPFRAP